MNPTRTHEEILAKMKSLQHFEDFFGVIHGDLIEYLPFDMAKEYLKPGVTQEQWNDVYKEATLKNIEKDILDYMPFAWEKANGCRGLSANRSVNHMEAWAWLTGDQKLIDGLEAVPYEHYGKEKLIFVCEYFKIGWKVFDDGVRTNTDS